LVGVVEIGLVEPGAAAESAEAARIISVGRLGRVAHRIAKLGVPVGGAGELLEGEHAHVRDMLQQLLRRLLLERGELLKADRLGIVGIARSPPDSRWPNREGK
jgi:hypothetical protein